MTAIARRVAVLATLVIAAIAVALQSQPHTWTTQAITDWIQLLLIAVACASASAAAAREHGAGRWLWIGVAMSVGIWGLAQSRYIYTGSAFFDGDDTLQTVLFLLMPLPLLPALALRPDDPGGGRGYRALDVGIATVLGAFIYFYIGLSVPSSTATPAYATWRVAAGWLVSCAVPIAFLIRYRSSGHPWRRLYAQLGVACGFWLIGDAAVTAVIFNNQYKPGLLDLPWLWPFAWIAVIAADWRPAAAAASPRSVWRETRHGALLALAAVASPLVLHIALSASAATPGAWQARSAATLITSMLVVGLFLTRELRALTAFEQEEAERLRQRRISEQRFSRAFHALPLGALILTEDGARIGDVNDRALDLLGTTRMEALRDGVPTLAPVVAAAVSDAARDRAARGWPLALTRPDGEQVATRAWVQPLDAGGERSLLVLLQDPRAVRRLERQVVQARNAETVGRLAGAIAHDLNNLLTAIVGSTEVARLHLAEPHLLRADLEHVVQAAGRAGALTTRLLAYGQGQAGSPQTIDVAELVGSSERTVRTLAGTALDVRLELPGTPVQVEMDPSELERILVNLVVNARDAMPDGGRLQIAVGTADRRDHAADHARVPPGCYAALVVSDSGAGMDAAVLPRIFEPFFTTKGDAGGAGLGLPSVLASARRAGGGVEVSSRPGLGTTFTVLLPLMGESAAPRPGLEARAAMPGGREVVLLVEDEDAVREIVRRVLERLGYTVLEASSGPRALQIARERPDRIDLLLTDVIMPEMNGAQLAEALTRERPELKVLYASGYSADVLGPVGMASREVALISKPFTPGELAARVRDVLDS